MTTGLKWAPDTAPNMRMSPTRAPAVAAAFEQLEADVTGREAAGHDARPDDRDEEEATAERLGGQPAGEIEPQPSGAGLGLFVETSSHLRARSAAPRRGFGCRRATHDIFAGSASWPGSTWRS